MKNQFRIVITAKPDNILVERQMHLTGERYTTVDRYTTADLKKPIKRNDPWIRDLLKLCSQPGACLGPIEFTVPELEETQQERLTRVENAYIAMLMDEANRVARDEPIKGPAVRAAHA